MERLKIPTSPTCWITFARKGRKFLVFLFIFFFPLAHAGFISHASERLPFNPQLKKLIEETFYKDGRPSLEKITQYQSKITRRYQQVKQNLKTGYLLEQRLSPGKTKKKVKSKGEIRSFKILLDYIEQLKLEEDPLKFKRLALKIFELDCALKVSGLKLASIRLAEKLFNYLKTVKIPIKMGVEGEASNLVNPKSGIFFSQEELIEFKKKRGDISKLNPPADSTFWTDHAVSRIDVKKHFQTGQDALHKGLEIIFPEKKATFKKIRRTQTKPKIDLFFMHKGKKVELKLKVGAEVHSEVTCGALFAALGYSVDISKYVRDFKVILGEIPFYEFRREWESYYTRYELDRYIKEQGKDKEGYYIIFHEGVLEAKPKGLLRVGPWAYGLNGNGGLREVRGSFIFNMWVSNMDLKEAENNKLILRKYGDQYKFFHIQHDMGFAFGTTYIERPGLFKWDLVKKRTEKYIHMTYRCFQKNTGFKYITYSDARWMARLIARLTRQQITDAVTLAGWPESLRKLVVEKLISRRNQLVKAFFLEGEKTSEGDTINLLKFDRYLTTPDNAVVKGKLKTYWFKGHPLYYGPRFNEVIAMASKGFLYLGIDSFVDLLASVKYIVLDPQWFGLDPGIISKIIMRIDRDIELNPNPTSESDSFLVKDSLEIGLRLGYGFVLGGDIAYTKKYTLVYPVATMNKGRFHDKFILNILLPFKSRGRNLPRNHVIMIEDYLEGRGKIKLRPFTFPLKCLLTSSKVFLRRYFLSHKDNQRVIFWEDKSFYDELKLRIFIELLNTFRIPILKDYIQKGTLNRDQVEMDITDLETNPRKRKALDQLLLEGDFTLLKELGRHKTIEDEFLEKKSTFRLLGFMKRRSIFRVDKLKLKEEKIPHSNNPDEPGISFYYQVESRKLKTWNFVDDGERFYSIVRLSGETDNHKTVKNPSLTIFMQINDNSTMDKELKNGYLHFIDTVALNKGFINFNSTSHSINRIWGSTQVFVNITLYEEAIENLIHADEERIWTALAEITGQSTVYWHRKLEPRLYRGRPVAGCYSWERYLAEKTRYFIKSLQKARKAGDSFKKMRHVVKAVRKAIYTSRKGFNPIHLAIIHMLSGEKNIYINAKVTMPENRENVFPARASLYNEIGIKRRLEVPIFQFIFDDPSEIYYLF